MPSAFETRFANARTLQMREHGTPCVYTPVGGAGINLTAILSPTFSDLVEDANSRTMHYQRHIQIQTSDVARPKHGDVIDAGGGDIWIVDHIVAVDAGMTTALATQPVRAESALRKKVGA